MDKTDVNILKNYYCSYCIHNYNTSKCQINFPNDCKCNNSQDMIEKLDLLKRNIVEQTK
jgi:hypothetical protein